MNALKIAATGMLAQQLNVDVISNNIANMQTTGYKRMRADFQDLLYQDLRPVGTASSQNNTTVPTGLQVGFGVKTGSTSRIMSQGALTFTEKELDIAINGEGFLPISLPNGNTAYTRDGSLQRDNTGRIVTIDGYPIGPNEITIPDNAKDITITKDGVVQGKVGNALAATTFGQIQLARFVNKAGLEALGGNLFSETDSSGTPDLGDPDTDGRASIQHKFLETANVNALSELSALISAQRAYEMNARVVSGADEMMSTTANISR